MENMQYILDIYTRYLNTPRDTLNDNIRKIYKQHGIKFHNQATAKFTCKEYNTVAACFKMDGNRIQFDDILKIAMALNEPVENFIIA